MPDNIILLPCPNPACKGSNVSLEETPYCSYVQCNGTCKLRGPMFPAGFEPHPNGAAIAAWDALPRSLTERDTLRAQMATKIAHAELLRTDNQFGNDYIRFGAAVEECHASDAAYCVAVADAILAAVQDAPNPNPYDTTNIQRCAEKAQ
jgi:hypothetical protein